MKFMEDQALPSTTPRLGGGWSQSGRVRVTGLQGGGFEDKPSVQLFVVEDCSRS